MANLYRKKNSEGKLVKSWYCTFRVPGADGSPKQVHRSTGKTTKKDAEAAARLLEEAALAEAGAGDEQSKAIMQKVTEAGELAMRGRLNPARAIQLIQEIRRLGGDEAESYTIAGWMDKWLELSEGKVASGTLDKYHGCVKYFKISLGERAYLPLDLLSLEDIESHLEYLKNERKLAASTRNLRLRVIKDIFRAAVKRDLLIKSPLEAQDPDDEDDSVDRLPMSHNEVQRLLEASPDAEWHGLILFAVYTGLRLEDVSRLTTSQVLLDQQLIKLIPRKTRRSGKEVEIPMHPDLLDYCDAHPLPPFKDSPIFPSLSNTLTTSLSTTFKDRIMPDAGVDPMLKRKRSEGAARDVSQKTFHSLRHSFNSWMADKEVPEDLRMNLSAHTSKATSRNYTHRQLETLRKAINKMEKLS